jgi:hypothetical protein
VTKPDMETEFRNRLLDLDGFAAHVRQVLENRVKPEDRPPPRQPRAKDPTNVVLIGAGLASAVVSPEGLDWEALVDRVQKRLEEDPNFPKDAAPGDKNLRALRLSRACPRRRDALPSSFQRAVQKVVQESRAPSKQEMLTKYQDALARFLDRTGCNVILDLNYDPLVETLLKAADLPFLKMVGSEFHWDGPCFGGGLLLWKVHGDVGLPATITLSPTEYSRTYETNALGSALEALGGDATTIWSIGVGLTDDEVWYHLCSPRCKANILPILTTKGTSQALPVADHHVKWLAHVTQAASPIVKIGHQNFVETRLYETLTRIAGCIPEAMPSRDLRRFHRELPGYLVDKAAEFDEIYLPVQAKGDNEKTLAVVKLFQAEFDAVRSFLLSQRIEKRMGSRWLESIRPRPIEGKPSRHEILGTDEKSDFLDDIRSILEAAEELCGEHLKEGRKQGLLVAAASQAAVAYALQVADLLEVDLAIDLKEEPKGHSVGTDNPDEDKPTYLVGSNPFFVRVPRHHNLMHFASLDRKFQCKAPFTEWPRDDAPAGLLKEDEWEAAVIDLYRRRKPSFDVKGKPLDVGLRVPPLYPWGFRFSDIRRFRKNTDGAISFCWLLVDDFREKMQICKGGSLRDQERRSFLIGGNGLLRVGEFDEFLAPASYTASAGG